MPVPATESQPSKSANEPDLRSFGAYRIRQLIGTSHRTMVWLAHDARCGQDRWLAMPRARPRGTAETTLWHQAARRAARVAHPSLAPVSDIGEHDRWPYLAYDPGQSDGLTAKLSTQSQSSSDVVHWAIDVLEGLAFAHEAGIAHHDLQTHMVLLPAQGPARLVGLGVAVPPHDAGATGLQAQHRAGERDLLAMGLILYHALTGQPALDQADVALVIDRLPPTGHEAVRLSWTTARSIPEALRAIVNRAVDRQVRHRYRNARTLLRALEGWLKAEGESGAGPLALLLDRMRTVGLLPAMPGAAQRAARMALMDRERNDELAEVVLQDTALSFEMIRMVNSAQVRGAMAAGSGPILTVRRAIDMLGLDGVRRAALALRSWPGPMNDTQAAALEGLVERVRKAGRIAQWLRPAGYDGEVVFLLTLLQNLGRLVVHYHFPDEAQQIERLMRPGLPTSPDDAVEPGMSEAAASFAVMGVDVATIGLAIGRHWGLDEAVLRMIERQVASAPVRSHGSDTELLRLTASCANEVVDLYLLPAPLQAVGLQRIAQRYARALGTSLRDLQSAALGLPSEPLAPRSGAPDASEGAAG